MKSIMVFIIFVVSFVGCEPDFDLTGSEIYVPTYIRYASRLQLKFENGEYCTWAIGDNSYKVDKNGFMSMYKHLPVRECDGADTLISDFTIRVAAYGPIMWEGEIEWVIVGECAAYGLFEQDCPKLTIWPRTRQVTIPDSFMVWAP